ncbi:MAG: magnesium transporter [Phycisphaerales bacterium]|nr:magnesium transporter [Phycisphaerae bacterium]NNF43142.1 magnesium transporter [Phycisphaerales bacterium]NNM27424.1 magnesium transporter [Phycisphaerales bacterium]
METRFPNPPNEPDRPERPDRADRADQPRFAESPTPDGESLTDDERVAELLTHTIDVPVLAEAVAQQEPADAADTLEHLEEEAAELLVAMDDAAAAEALAEMEAPLAAGVLGDLLDEGNAAYAGRLVGLMAPDDAADLLQSVEARERAAVYREMPAPAAAGLQKLVGYAETSAGGLMTTDFIALDETLTVAEATDVLRGRELPEDIHELPVIDRRGVLVGTIGLRTLLVHAATRRVGELMDAAVKSIRHSLDQEDVAREFDRYDLHMLPVVDDADRLLGVVTVDDVIDIIRAEQTEDVQKTVGAGAGEAVYSSILEKFRGRFPWLVVSVLIMIPSAWVVLQFEELIGKLAVLAMLMPVVAALAGNAGHQALAVTLRGIVLEEVRADRVWPLIRREAIAGLLTGAAVGVLVGGAIAVLSILVADVSWRLGLIATISMTCSMAAGTLAGSGIPLLMRRCGADPAQSSAIFLIMITDAVAFLTFLGLSFASYRWLISGEA